MMIVRYNPDCVRDDTMLSSPPDCIWVCEMSHQVRILKHGDGYRVLAQSRRRGNDVFDNFWSFAQTLDRRM